MKRSQKQFRNQENYQKKYLNNTSRKLIHKKFVNQIGLVISLFASLSYAVFIWMMLKESSILISIGLIIPLLFLSWNKFYQVFYDLKIINSFDDSYNPHLKLNEQNKLPAVAVIIPSFEEPFQVAKMTFDSVVNTDYKGKKEIIVVDNSQHTDSENFKKWFSYINEFNTTYPDLNVTAKFIFNPTTNKLKPGNLDLAEEFITEGEFVVILDIDSTLPQNQELFNRAIAEFKEDSKLGFLQFHMKATNNHFNSLTQSIAASQDLHRLRLTSRSYGGYKIFEGHNGMWRRSVLKKTDSWTNYYKGNIMITEDILKSSQVYALGYYGKSINIETGEWVPSSLGALENMWMRWTYGTNQVLFKCFHDLFLKGTNLIEKFDAIYHVLHHFANGFILPIAFILQLFVPGPMTNLFLLITFIIPQFIGGVTIYFKSLKKSEYSFIQNLGYLYSGFFMIDTLIMSIQLRSTFNFLSGMKLGWKVTEKGIGKAHKTLDYLISKVYHFGIAAICIGISIIPYKALNYGHVSWVDGMALSFLGINLILCLLIFRNQSRKTHNQINSEIFRPDAPKVLEDETPYSYVNP